MNDQYLISSNHLKQDGWFITAQYGNETVWKKGDETMILFKQNINT